MLTEEKARAEANGVTNIDKPNGSIFRKPDSSFLRRAREIRKKIDNGITETLQILTLAEITFPRRLAQYRAEKAEMEAAMA